MKRKVLSHGTFAVSESDVSYAKRSPILFPSRKCWKHSTCKASSTLTLGGLDFITWWNSPVLWSIYITQSLNILSFNATRSFLLENQLTRRTKCFNLVEYYAAIIYSVVSAYLIISYSRWLLNPYT